MPAAAAVQHPPASESSQGFFQPNFRLCPRRLCFWGEVQDLAPQRSSGVPQAPGTTFHKPSSIVRVPRAGRRQVPLSGGNVRQMGDLDGGDGQSHGAGWGIHSFSSAGQADPRATKHPSGKQAIPGPPGAHGGGGASPWAAPAFPGGWHSSRGPRLPSRRWPRARRVEAGAVEGFPA